MSFSAVGSSVTTGNNTLSLSPHAVGNFFLVEVISAAPHYCSSISGGNCTWTQVGTTFTGTVNSTWVSTVFIGTVNATGSASATYTYSGGTPSSSYSVGQEFSSSIGAWALGAQGNLDSSGTNALPSLTPAGAGELYFGFFIDGASNVVGSTSGYTYGQDAYSNGFCYDAACTSAAQAPTMGDSGNEMGIAVLLKETAATVTATTAFIVW